MNVDRPPDFLDRFDAWTFKVCAEASFAALRESMLNGISAETSKCIFHGFCSLSQLCCH